MVASRSQSPADLVARLGAADADQRFRAIRDVKNQIIGNKSKKLSYIKLGAVPRVVELLASSESEYGVRIQCAATVGSFAYGVDDGLQAVLESGGVSQLIQMLSSLDERIVEAGVRALKMVFQSKAASQTQLLTEDALQRLVYLLLSDNRSVAEVAAKVLARCCNTPEQKAVVAEAGGVAGLLRLLTSEELPRREAAVDALATLTADNPDVIRRVTASGDTTKQLLQLLKSPGACVRFLAAQCLANLAPALPSTSDTASQSGQAVRKAVLPVLAKLLSDVEVREEVPHVLSQLLMDNEELQAAAADADAISKLASFLHQEGCSTRLKEGTLRALSTLCAEREASRRQLVDAHAMDAIVRALDDPTPQVRAAACMCVRSLSRSVKALRSSLVDADVAAPLFRRLSDPDPDVQNTASATLCNIVLDFSPVKDAVVAAGCIPMLVRLSSLPNGELRLNAVWALQNLVYTASSDVRKAVLAAISWQHVQTLADDIRSDVQERALNLLRNLCAHCPSTDVKLMLEWSNDELYQLLISRVDLGASHTMSQRVHALYTLVNIAAAGEEQGREAIMQAGLPAMLPRLLSEGEEEARLAAVWCVINLTNNGADYPEAPKRVATLREAGVSAVLADMHKDRLGVDIRERVKTALDNFVAVDMFTE